VDADALGALTLAAVHAAHRSPHFAATVLPALHRCHASLDRGARVAVVTLTDHAIRDARAGVWTHRGLDESAWRTLQDVMLEDRETRRLYEVIRG